MGVGADLYMYDVVVKNFTFAILSPDESLYTMSSCTQRLPTFFYRMQGSVLPL